MREVGASEGEERLLRSLAAVASPASFAPAAPTSQTSVARSTPIPFHQLRIDTALLLAGLFRSPELLGAVGEKFVGLDVRVRPFVRRSLHRFPSCSVQPQLRQKAAQPEFSL